MKTFRNFVDGEWADAADGATTDIIDPTTGDAYAVAALSGDADIDAAMSAAANAFESWKNTTPAERSLAMLKLADAMEARGDEIMHLECENTGKPYEVHRDEEMG
jgi:betaine-aldehyde dehydrogenase